MRRTILLAAMVLLVLSFVAMPASAAPPPGPIYRMICANSMEEIWVAPARGGSAGWTTTDSYGPILLMSLDAIRIWPDGTVEGIFATPPLGLVRTDMLTYCEIHGPVLDGTSTDDPYWQALIGDLIGHGEWLFPRT